jgi:threonine dehydrogenase-like Zn-dependent dehydrogenase
VFAVEPAPFRREKAAEIGCAVIDPGTEDPAGRLREATEGRGVDIAVNTSATDAGLQSAIDAVCMEGTVVEASWRGSQSSTLALGGSFHRRRLTIRSSQVSRLCPSLTPRWDKTRRASVVLDLLGRLEPHRLISHRFPLSRAADAFRLIDEDAGRTLQVILDPQEKEP